MDLLRIIEVLILIALMYLLALLAFVKIPEANELSKECTVTILCEHGVIKGLLCDRYNVTALPLHGGWDENVSEFVFPTIT